MSKPEQQLSRRSTSEMESDTSTKPMSICMQLVTTIKAAWVNCLLVFVPVGIIVNYTVDNPTVVFAINFIAIIPLASFMSHVTEDISLYCSEILGGLINASFGNAVEIIVSIIALRKHEIVIVQTSLIGSILSNLLLVLGMAFVVGGIDRIEQNFNHTVTQSASSLLALAVSMFIVPTAFYLASPTSEVYIVKLSRGYSIIVLLVYCSSLLFQLKTHRDSYNLPSQRSTKRGEEDRLLRGPPEKLEIPKLSLPIAVVLLICSTALVGLCSEYLVKSIDNLVTSTGISRVFVGLILLPIVGNAAEHFSAVTAAAKDKMNLTIGIAVGSAEQIALLVIPLIVVLGWVWGINDMTLYFNQFQVTGLFLAVWLAGYVLQDGRSNYLEGELLIAVYILIALAAFYLP